MSASSPKPSTGTGVIDHVGFRTTGLHEMIEHLTKNKIDFNERQVDDQGLYQLFLFDPNGVKIELNFANAEAKGRTPQLKASGTEPGDELSFASVNVSQRRHARDYVAGHRRL